MMISLRKAAVAASLACVASFASAATLTFDGMSPSFGFFTSNYQGFKFGDNNGLTNPWFHTVEVSPYYIPHSGTGYVATDFSLYTGALFEDTLPISNTTPFVFQGAWFSGGDQVLYKLYSGSTLVWTSAASGELGNVPIFVPSGYANPITSVVISGKQGYYAMDDFTYTLVPEPASGVLLMLGALGVGAAVRRRTAG